MSQGLIWLDILACVALPLALVAAFDYWQGPLVKGAPWTLRLVYWVLCGFGLFLPFGAACIPIGVAVDNLDPNKIWLAMLGFSALGCALLLLGRGLAKRKKWTYYGASVIFPLLVVRQTYLVLLEQRASWLSVFMVLGICAGLFVPPTRKYFKEA